MPKFLQRLALVYITVSIHLSVIFPGLSYRQIYRKFKKVVLGLAAHVTPSFFSSRILGSEALVYKSHFSQNSRSTEIIRQKILIQILISHAFAYSSRWRRKP